MYIIGKKEFVLNLQNKILFISAFKYTCVEPHTCLARAQPTEQAL